MNLRQLSILCVLVNVLGACAATNPERATHLAWTSGTAHAGLSPSNESAPVASSIAPSNAASLRALPASAFGSSHVLLAQEAFDNNTPIGEAWSIGIESAFESPDSWIGGEGGLELWQASDSESYLPATATGGKRYERRTTTELYGGAHKTFLPNSFLQPYVGAGISVSWTGKHAHTRIDLPGGTTRNTQNETFVTLGAYAHAGVAVQISEFCQVGLDVRQLIGTDVGLFGPAADIDAKRIAVFIGMGN